MLMGAEKYVKEVTSTQSVVELSRIAAWRGAYKAFGANPQRTRNTLKKP